MPSVEENKSLWDGTYDWSEAGDEWSATWGGPDQQWYFSILPRIHEFVPVETILEIAPGFGRWTQFLKGLCGRLVVVDMAESCIEGCRRRFASETHIEYHVNDGRSLEMVADASVDFAFSFDSLVHVELEVLEGYLRQLVRKLKPDGVAFLHHSNLGEHVAYLDRLERWGLDKSVLARWGLVHPLNHWRARSVTADRFRAAAEAAGLRCLTQEIVNWGTPLLIDCMSTLTPAGSRWRREAVILRNPRFMAEADSIREKAPLYGRSSFRAR